jgi:NADPH:quinone reductase
VKNLTVTGFWFGAYLDLAPARVRASLAQLLDWRAAGVLQPQAGHVLPFTALPEGLELLRTRRATGKVVIRVQDP